MAARFQMQAASSSNGLLYTWIRPVPDWNGAFFSGPGSAVDVAIACAPFVAGSSASSVTAAMAGSVSTPIAAMVGQVTATPTVFLAGYPEYFGWLSPGYVAPIIRKQFGANVLA